MIFCTGIWVWFVRILIGVVFIFMLVNSLGNGNFLLFCIVEKSVVW